MDNGDDSMRLPDPNADKANAQHGRSLENLLATKNKRLQQDLTELRVNNEELGQLNDDLSERLSSVQTDLARLKTLNEKLENDLMRVDNAGGKSVFGGGAASQWGGGSAWNGGFSPNAGADGDEGSDTGSMAGMATPAKSRGLAGLDLGSKKPTVSPGVALRRWEANVTDLKNATPTSGLTGPRSPIECCWRYLDSWRWWNRRR